MDNERVNFLIDRIEGDLKTLQVLTGNNHISAFISDNFYHFMAANTTDETTENDINISISRFGDEE